jgi:DNA anti-recombination protein RmuC
MTEDEIRSISARVAKLELEMAVNAERYRNIEGSLDKITSTINRLVMVVAGGFVMAVLNWALNGGLIIG